MGNQEKIVFNTRRIFAEISTKALISDNQSYYYLSYLKIQSHCSKNGGYFSISHLQEVLNTTLKTSQKHISKLLELGYIQNVSKDKYKTISQKSLSTNSKKQYLVIEDIELSKYNYKNISEFRALLMLIVDKQFQNKKQYAIKKQLSKKIDKIKQHDAISGYYDLLACSISSFYCNKSKATISRWRKKQSLVDYSSYMIFLNDYHHLSIEDINELNPLGLYGVYFKFKSRVIFSSISRVSFNGFNLRTIK